MIAPLIRSDPMTSLIGQTSFETVVKNEQFIYLQCQTNDELETL